MKKICFLFAFFFLQLTVARTQGMQEGLYEFTRSYFRADPFKGEFSSFVKALVNDPGYTNKVFHVRTDTSLFYFSATYSLYNPFFFKPTRVEVMLKETPIKYTEGMVHPDTILVYQLTAYSGGDEKGMGDVKKEFDKIHRRYYKKFFDNNYFALKTESISSGGIHNYFVPFHGISPLSVAWARTENESVLNIILRLKMSANWATLPQPLDNP